MFLKEHKAVNLGRPCVGLRSPYPGLGVPFFGLERPSVGLSNLCRYWDDLPSALEGCLST